MTDTKTINAILGEALAILNEECAWTQGVVARGCGGRRASFDNPFAERWGLTGAVRLAAKRLAAERVMDTTTDMSWYNQDYPIEEVVAGTMKEIRACLPEQYQEMPESNELAVAIWNDASGRQHIEVVDLLQAAAA